MGSKLLIDQEKKREVHGMLVDRQESVSEPVSKRFFLGHASEEERVTNYLMKMN